VDSLESGDIGWSWDNRYLAVTTRPQSEDSRLIVVDVSKGSYRELIRSDSDWLSSVRFSPDGRFIAYEATPRTLSSGTNRVHVVPVRGGEPHVAKEAPRRPSELFYVLKDWTADGRYLITKEAREGKSTLYLLPMKDGAPAGPSEFVRIGDFDDAHTTLSGALVYQDHATTPTDVAAFLASIDSSGHIGGWRRLDLRGGLNGKSGSYPWPTFSPDGDQIAYLATPTQGRLIWLFWISSPANSGLFTIPQMEALPAITQAKNQRSFARRRTAKARRRRICSVWTIRPAQWKRSRPCTDINSFPNTQTMEGRSISSKRLRID
jgi:WD40 repeat protein